MSSARQPVAKGPLRCSSSGTETGTTGCRIGAREYWRHIPAVGVLNDPFRLVRRDERPTGIWRARMYLIDRRFDVETTEGDPFEAARDARSPVRKRGLDGGRLTEAALHF